MHGEKSPFGIMLTSHLPFDWRDLIQQIFILLHLLGLKIKLMDMAYRLSGGFEETFFVHQTNCRFLTFQMPSELHRANHLC